MKVANLKKIFKDFYSNNDRAILIDGSWGIGKTHAILDFLEWTNYLDSGVPDNTIYKYVSLFGKESIDEIHTEIYKQFHPNYYRARKAINLIPKVASLGNFIPGTVGSVANTISSLQYTLKVTQNSPVKNKNINHQIVFLDDLERVDFNKISFNEILGYFDNLIRQGIKIITICCSEMLLKRYPQLENDFIGFKEKVFDREYKITATERETMLSYFDIPIDEDIIKEFNNNLRIAQRTSNFYKELKDFLKNKKINSDETYSDRELLEYCTNVIVETQTSNYKTYVEDTSGDSVFNSHIFYMEQDDKNIEENFKHIFYYRKSKRGYNCTNSKLLTALLQYYFYRDEENLLNIFELNETDEIFNMNIVLLSDEGKRELFSKQMQYVIDGKSLEKLNFIEIVCTWFRYSEFNDVLKKEDALIDAFIRNKNEWEKKIKNLLSAVNKTKCDDLNKFILKLDERIKKDTIDNLLDNIRVNWKNRNYKNLLNNLYSLTDSEIYFVDFTKKRFKPIIENLIKENNFFIEDLSGEIDYNQWNIALDISGFAQQYGFSKELKAHIMSLKMKDKSSEYRYKELLNAL